MTKYTDIDLEIEKLVFLEDAYDGNPGIYELTWELGHFKLSIEDKYRIAHEVLTSLLTEKLVVLEKFAQLYSDKPIETVDMKDIQLVLNNPVNWYPCNEVYSIKLTAKGEYYLNKQSEKNQDKLQNRIFGKNRYKSYWIICTNAQHCIGIMAADEYNVNASTLCPIIK